MANYPNFRTLGFSSDFLTITKDNKYVLFSEWHNPIDIAKHAKTLAISKPNFLIKVIGKNQDSWYASYDKNFSLTANKWYFVKPVFEREHIKNPALLCMAEVEVILHQKINELDRFSNWVDVWIDKLSNDVDFWSVDDVFNASIKALLIHKLIDSVYDLRD
jgi:hypothetical protein